MVRVGAEIFFLVGVPMGVSVAPSSQPCYTIDMTSTTSETTAIKTVLFFAYGTLRKGERLHGWIEGEIIESVGVAVMPQARLFYSKSHKAYPYLVLTENPNDNAVGEVYELPLSDQVLSMLQMEANAGYRIVEAEAVVNGEPVNVVVCVIDKSDAYILGDAVENNDWCSQPRTEWWS